MKRKIKGCCFFLLLLTGILAAQTVNLDAIKPLSNAYAHNDYWHKRPLWDALSKGFTAIEVDVHKVKNDLVIAHRNPKMRKRKMRLTKQYLKPLWKLYKKQNGQIYPNYNKPILLIIDLKTKAVPTYNLLLKELKPFQKMLTLTEGGELQLGAVTVIISGNRPVDLVSQQQKRWVFLDGRISDVGIQFTNDLTPMISDDWKRLFGHVAGHQKIPERDLEILEMMVKLAHLEGKKLRLWNTPEHKNIWSQLLQLGVDYINTDQLTSLSDFLNNQSSIAYDK